MLHEILLSLSGHPSPLLTAQLSDTEPSSSASASALSPSERQLLASAAHLSDLHIKLSKHAARVAASHPSAVCRAVATAVQSVHLAALRRKVLEVEAGILRHDAGLVGAYGIVPLTAVMGEFQPWTRRLEWLWEVVRFLEGGGGDDESEDGGGAARGRPCWGARAIDRLRAELQSGYRDVQEAAHTLVAAAETAWLRQVSAWIFYGRLPSADAGGGEDDFFVRATARGATAAADGAHAEEHYVVVPELLPAFVTPATGRSMLFIGRSLNQIRARSTTLSTASGFHNTAAKLQAVADLASPLNSAGFTGVVRDIRRSLSRDILEQILPLSEVMATMQLLREFFLLGRGEFATAITHEADERVRNRWRRAGHDATGGGGGGGVDGVAVKSGEVSAALARAWASLSSFEQQSGAGGEDALLDRARELLRLQLVKAPRPDTPAPAADDDDDDGPPFDALLFSAPVTLAMRLPPAVDMVLAPSDMRVYGRVNAYLVVLRRAHVRLTDLWRLTSLRRHFPGPRGAGEHARELRARWSARTEALREMWTTASAAVFFLGETEAYFQTEVVEGLWRGFRAWLAGEAQHDEVAAEHAVPPADEMDMTDSDEEDHHHRDDSPQHHLSGPRPPLATASRPTTSSSSAAAAAVTATAPRRHRHDQQTLATGHAAYLGTLVHRLLLAQPSYTRPLHALLAHIDQLAAHVHRLHALFAAADLAADAGVLSSFSGEEAEAAATLRALRAAATGVRAAMELVVAALERLSVDEPFLQAWEDGAGAGAAPAADGAAGAEEELLAPGEAYRPARAGGLNRLLMQLKFGS